MKPRVPKSFKCHDCGIVWLEGNPPFHASGCRIGLLARQCVRCDTIATRTDRRGRRVCDKHYAEGV